MSFKSTQDARAAGIETVYQTLAVAPALDIASNLFLAREIRRKGPLGSVLRMLDTGAMRSESKEHVKSLGISTLQNINQAVETLSGGQRQAVAVARAAAFGGKVVILDEPTAALGVRETGQVLRAGRRDARARPRRHPGQPQHAQRVRDRRPHPGERLGAAAAVITPGTHSMQDAVAIMTGAMTVEEKDQTLGRAPERTSSAQDEPAPS